MNTVPSLKKAAIICAAAVLAVTAGAWQNRTATPRPAQQDTVPAKGEKKVMNVDDALENLEHAEHDLKTSIKNMDWEKMEGDMKTALKDMDVNLKNMQVDLKKSLAEIDMDKIRLDVETSVAKIDLDKLKTEIDNIKQPDWDNIKAELEAATANLKKLKPELEKNLTDAHKNIGKAKEELLAYKTFISTLDADGLINKKEAYTITHKNGVLTINGTRQRDAVYNKYRAFLEKNKNFTLMKNSDGFSIDNE